MNSKDLAVILNELLSPVMDDVDALKKAFEDVVNQIGDADVTKAELKSFVIERASEERDRLLRDRDAFRGDKGDRGERGLPGQNGKDGEHGRDGKDGLNGKDGSQGKRGERGERGYAGKDGKDGRDGNNGIQGERGFQGERGDKGDKGDRGETGLLKAVEPWREREYTAGEVVSHQGATWQARRKTQNNPSYTSNSWELIANGISDFEFDGRRIKFVAADGETRTSPDLQGDKGDKGDTPYITGPYDEKRQYAAHEGVQQDGGCWYPAEGKSGKLGKPGKSPDWKLVATRGKTGPAGKDADPEHIREQVLMDIAKDNAAIIDMTIKQVDEYLSGVNFV